MTYNGLKEIFLSFGISKIDDIILTNKNDVLKKILDKFPNIYVEGNTSHGRLKYIFEEMLAQEYKEKRTKAETRKGA